MTSIELSTYRSMGIGFYRDVVKIVLNPKSFFQNMPAEKDHRAAVTFLCTCAVIYSIAATVFAYESHATYFVLMLANGLLYPVVTAAALRFVLYAAGASKTAFHQTFAIVAYANAVLLLAWIPGIAPFTEIFKYYLIGVGLVHVLKMSRIKALTIIVATIAALLLMLYLAKAFIVGSAM